MSEGFDLDATYRRFGEAVWHRARRTLRDDGLADDVVQETFLRAWRYRDGYRGGSMLSWLFTIADRVILDTLRKRGAVVDDDDARAALARADRDAVAGQAGPQAPRPLSGEERLLRDEHVARALAVADDDTARILLHRYVDELSTDDISRRTGQSERTIRRRLEAFFARVAGLDRAAPEPPCAA